MGTLKRYDCINRQSIMPQVQNIIAIGSGKGGVGKSTVTFSLACALHKMGLNVGIVDADIYGPSLSHLSGISDKASVRHDKLFEPHIFKGIPLLSIAHLVEKQQALAWRGPMASGALMQLIHQTAWPKLDLLLIDLPPGTGDIHLTLGQKVPLTGVVLVTNDHPLSLDDYHRGKTLYDKLGVKNLGTIVNNLHLSQDNAEERYSKTFEPYLGSIGYSEDIYRATASSRFLYENEKGYQDFMNVASNVSNAISALQIFQDIPFKVK